MDVFVKQRIAPGRSNQMQNKKYHTVGTIPKKYTKKEAKSILLTQIHDRSLSWLGTGTSIKSGEIKLILWTFAELVITNFCNYLVIEVVKYKINFPSLREL